MMGDETLAAKVSPAQKRLAERGWVLAAATVLLVLATLGLLWPTTLVLLEKWQPTEDTTYGHGFLIFAVAIWLLFNNRQRLSHAVPQANPLAAVLLLSVSLLWLVAVRAGILTVHLLLMPVIFWLVIGAALGLRIAVSSSFAVGYLYFALPVWDMANGLLQSITSVVVALLLKVSAVHAFVDGNFIHLAAGTFEIAGGCSGLHFMIVALALAALYGEIGNDTLQVRAKLLVLAGVLAAVTNWVRVYVIILAGYMTDMQHYLVRVEHYKFGWLVFAIMMVGFFLIARRMPLNEVENRTAPLSDNIGSAAAVRGAAFALAVLALAPVWNALVPLAPAAAPAQPSLLPQNPGSWRGPAADAQTAWKPNFVGADLTAQGAYISGERRVAAYTALYLSQVQDRELVGYRNSVSGANAVVAAEMRIAAPVPSIEATLQGEAGGQAIVRYFYEIDSTATNRGILAQLAYAVRSLFGNPVSRVVAVHAECVPDCAAARASLDDFQQAMGTGGLTTVRKDRS